MKAIRTIVALLLAGAIVNGVVAWICGAAIDIHGRSMRYTRPVLASRPDLDLSMRECSGALRMSVRSPRYPMPNRAAASGSQLPTGWSQLVSAIDAIAASRPIVAECVVDARGWPFLSFWCVPCAYALYPNGGDTSETLKGAIPVSKQAGSASVHLLPSGIYMNIAAIRARSDPYPRLLPFRPLWAGFSLNTLIYAAAIGASWMIYRRFRRASHLPCCARCGYPIGEAPRCSECGHALSIASSVDQPRSMEAQRA